MDLGSSPTPFYQTKKPNFSILSLYAAKEKISLLPLNSLSM